MAFTAATVRQAAEVFVADITATLDADVGPLNIAHGLGSVPLDITITPTIVEFHTSAFIVTATATNLVVTKANAVGSGAAGVQARVVARVDAYRDR